ncbi:MAG: heavy metal-associated domain-containing protein [bacterium]
MKYKIIIDGMHCEGCAKSLYKKLTSIPGVKKAVINIINRDAVIDTSDEVTADILKRAVITTGFEVESIAVIE